MAIKRRQSHGRDEVLAGCCLLFPHGGLEMTLQETNLRIEELMEELRNMEVRTARMRSRAVPQSGLWVLLTRKLENIREIKRQYRR